MDTLSLAALYPGYVYGYPEPPIILALFMDTLVRPITPPTLILDICMYWASDPIPSLSWILYGAPDPTSPLSWICLCSPWFYFPSWLSWWIPREWKLSPQCTFWSEFGIFERLRITRLSSICSICTHKSRRLFNHVHIKATMPRDFPPPFFVKQLSLVSIAMPTRFRISNFFE
jgi:hypothetical protein